MSFATGNYAARSKALDQMVCLVSKKVQIFVGMFRAIAISIPNPNLFKRRRCLVRISNYQLAFFACQLFLVAAKRASTCLASKVGSPASIIVVIASRLANRSEVKR